MPAKVKSGKPVKQAVQKPAPVVPPLEVVTPPPVAVPVENLEQILDSTSGDSSSEGKNRLVFGIGTVGAFCLIAGSIIVFLIYLGSSKTSQKVVHPPAGGPTATPIPAFVRSSVTFEVINASGVSGAATKGAAALTRTGYSVITIGNGKKQTGSELLLSKSLPPAAVSEILADINNLFSVASSSGDLTGSTASARIVLGSK